MGVFVPLVTGLASIYDTEIKHHLMSLNGVRIPGLLNSRCTDMLLLYELEFELLSALFL